MISIDGNNNGNMADDDDGDELSSIAKTNGNLTGTGRTNMLVKRHSVATTNETVLVIGFNTHRAEVNIYIII